MNFRRCLVESSCSLVAGVEPTAVAGRGVIVGSGLLCCKYTYIQPVEVMFVHSALFGVSADNVNTILC